MKRYIKTALLTILLMLVLTGGVGILIGKAYFSNQEKEDSKKKEEMDMNLYGFSKVSTDGLEIYELELSGEFKNVETFKYADTKSVYNVKQSEKVKTQLEELKKKNKYSIETPLWAYNPFGTNKLSMYLYFKTVEPYSLKYTIHVENDDIPDFTRNCYNETGTVSKEHEYQITGLVPGVKNYIFLSLYNKKGEVAKQLVYSITPKTPKDAPKRMLSYIEGKSSEKLSNGLYVFMGEDIYLYDNSGVLRGIMPIENYHTVNMYLLDGNLIYNYSKNGFTAVNAIGQVKEVYTLKDYEIYNDFVYDGYKNLLILASNGKSNTVGDRVVTLNLENGKSKELLNFGELLSGMKQKAKLPEGENKLNWLNLNSVVMTGSDSILVSSKELSSIIKVSQINSIRPKVTYILSQDTVWAKSGYESLLYNKIVLEEGVRNFKNQFGQSSLSILKEKGAEQYSVVMLNHNYANSSTRGDIKWKEVEGIGTKDKKASASKYYEYLISEEENTYALTNNFALPYSKEGSLFLYDTHVVVNVQDKNTLYEYDEEGKLIRGLEYKEKNMAYKIQKQSMKEFWYR